MNCPSCGTQLLEGASFCARCGRPALPVNAPAQSGLWFQNYYRIRKKVVAIANQYWIEDSQQRVLGYSRQKMIRIKENIPVFLDDSMRQEIFRIQQDQVVDAWGTFSVVDSSTGGLIGKIRREALSSAYYKDKYVLIDHMGNNVGSLSERAGRGLARKYMPGGGLVPEKIVMEFFGQEVGEIKQQFKVIGDIWEADCTRIPPQFDRRTLIAAMLLMGMIERDRK
jgi:hypothetical protein